MSAENVIDRGISDDEQKADIERALAAASNMRDTPLDSGYGYAYGYAGQNMPIETDAENVEIVTTIQPVPYCGDERPFIRVVRPPIDPFMRDLPA